MTHQQKLASQRSRFTLKGGPMHGATVWLESDSTLVFTMKGQTGHYSGRTNVLVWKEQK